MISSEAQYNRQDLEALIGQIEWMQVQIEESTQKAQDAIDNLQRERTYRIHIQRALRKQESAFNQKQKDMMQMVEIQLKDQESFILGIKLNLANLNKNYMEKQSELKREKVLSATYSIEKQNLQHALLSVK